MYEKNVIARMVSAVSRLQLAYLSRKFTPYGLGSGSYYYLVLVVENPGITQSELAEAVVIDRATVSKMIDKLLCEKLVRRFPHPTDRRAAVLEPTPKGKDVYESAIGILTGFRETMFEGVSEEERRVTLDTLRKITANIRRASDSEKRK